MQPWQYPADMTWKMLANTVVIAREKVVRLQEEVDQVGLGHGRQAALAAAIEELQVATPRRRGQIAVQAMQDREQFLARQDSS